LFIFLLFWFFQQALYPAIKGLAQMENLEMLEKAVAQKK